MEAKIRQKIIDIVTKLAEQIRNNHVAAGQVASGKTRDSIKVEVTDSKDGFEAVIYGREAFHTLEKGFKGSVSYSTIYRWSIDKGIRFEDERERKSFAFLVSKKIGEEGTLLMRKGGRNDIYSQSIKAAIPKIQGVISQFMTEEIKTIKLN